MRLRGKTHQKLALMEKIQVDRPQKHPEKARFGFFKNFHNDRDFNLFLLAGLFAGIGAGINTSIFNNYLSDIFKLSEDIRGFLEVPREAPGFLFC